MKRIQEVKSLKAKLSEETALALTLQEENKKLKKTLECVSKEKADLVSQTMKATGVSDMIEEKIETEIYGLKKTFLEEMAKLNSQFEKSVHFTRTTIHPSEPPAQQLQGSVDSSTLEQTDMNGVDNELQEARGTCSALIIGDSTTNILSQKRLCDTNLQVRIKSLSEDRLESIHNTIIGMAEDVDEFICDTNAVVIHAGTKTSQTGIQSKQLLDNIQK